MKKILILAFIALCSFGLSSCHKNVKWEYKVVSVAGEANLGGDFGGMTFADPTKRLDQLGEDGWELVSTYTEVTTVHPNYGNSQYVTGLQPNTRTAVVNYVFKRRK